MKSPFAVFRKHQKVLMVVLTGLAMFAFVVLDSLTQNMAAFPPIFGCLVGLGLAWWLSGKAKHSWVWLLVGGVAGGILGNQFQIDYTANAAVKTSFGEISETELNSTIQRRGAVNEFLTRAFQAANSNEEQPNYQMLRSYQFGGNGDPAQEALMHILMLKEAEKINFAVSNDQISMHIDQATNNKLSEADYKRILREMNLSDTELYDLFREQMITQSIRRQLMPQYVASPENYWDAYQKINVSEELAVVPISVESFKDQVGTPKEDELKELFEKYKDQFPGGPEPGFRQPGRIKLGYIEIDYDTVAKTIPEVTEEDVIAFYEANKDLYRNNVPGEFPNQTEGMNPSGENPFDSPPLDGPLLGPGMTAPESTSAPIPSPEKTSSEAPKPAESVSPKPEMTTSPAPESTPSATPIPETGTSPPEEKPAVPEGTSEPQSSLIRKPFGDAFARIQDEPTETQPPAETPKPAETTAPTETPPKPAETPAPKETPKPAEPLPPVEASTSEPPAPAGTSETPAEPVKEEMKVEAPPAAAEPLPEFQPLDDNLKEQIRTQLKTDRVLAKMESIAAEARGELFKINSRYASADDSNRAEIVAEIQKAADEYAKKNMLRYVETPYYSAEELGESEDHPIGSSTEPAANRFQRTEAVTVVEQHFNVSDLQSLERQRYIVFDAEDPRTFNRFLHWQIDFMATHTPTWEEEGVQELVKEAWISIQAQKLAEKRATEVAEMLRTSDKTWGETLESQTESGKEGSQSLVVSYTGPFTWLTRSSAPNPNPFMPPALEISDIPIIFGGVTNDFMENVFRDMNAGDIGLAWGGDRRYINVVRVDNRSDIEKVRREFLASQGSLFSPLAPYMMMNYDEGRNLLIRWNSEIYKQYEVKWINREEE